MVKKVLQSFKERIKEPKMDENTCHTAIFAALLHDIGHFPFSHATESLVKFNFSSIDHEILSSNIVKTPYIRSAFDVIEDKWGIKLDPQEVSNLIVGKAESEKMFLANLIKGFIDADRMDYLVRDAYYTGVPFGRVDLERLAKTLVPIKDRGNWILGVEEKGRTAVESLIIARSLMHSSVYYHHTKRVAEAMLARAATFSLNENNFPLLQLAELNDKSLLWEISTATTSKKLAKQIINRELLKRVVEIKTSNVKNLLVLKDFCEKKLFEKMKCERRLCKKLYLETGEIILDFPGIPRSKEIDFPVSLNETDFVPLWQISNHLVPAAEAKRRKDWTAYVFCSQREQKIKDSIKDFLGSNLGFKLN